jgi:Kef-type K+ transport system membrane component KefB
MNNAADVDALLILLLGGTLLAAVLINSFFSRLRIPALVGYVLLGVCLRMADDNWHFLTPTVSHAFRFMADIGIVALLFKVGLESHPGALAAKLPRASVIWLGDVTASACIGFITAHYLLDVALIPSLVVAAALTATSVGVCVAAWESNRALNSSNGQLLIDVAELDDISGIALMAILFTVVPVLLTGDGDLWGTLGTTSGLFIVKLALFIGACVLFVRYGERRLTDFTKRLRQPPQRMLMVISVGFMIAALAGWLGFSLAIGAMFAGLVFSRDPEAVKTEKSFQDLYDFVTPFFFVGIGLNIDPESLGNALLMGAALIAAAMAGKFIGAGTPALFAAGPTGAVLIGISMMPRAEIAMVIMHQGQSLGEEVVPNTVYSAMVMVSAATCLIAPLALYPLLGRWKQPPDGEDH